MYLCAKGGITRIVRDYAGHYGMYTEVNDGFRIALENGHYSRLDGRVVGVVTCTSKISSCVKRVVKSYHFIDVNVRLSCVLHREPVLVTNT